MKQVNRIISLLIVAILFVGQAWAERISPEEAAKIAASFINERPALRKAHKAQQTAASMRLAHTRKKAASEDNAFYVFNRADEAGFIIVSADDRTAEDVLAYTENGSFDANNINPNLKFWLSRYEEEISAITDNDEAARQPRKAVQVAAIPNLLVNAAGREITWYQETPYNNYCPIDQRDQTRSLTGCVATATSAIMYKWQYPAKGTGKRTYTWKDCMDDNCSSYKNITVTSNFDTVTFDWNNLLPAYDGVSATAAQKKAVASLMYNAGVAAKMQYGGDANEGSGAWTDDMAEGLKNYFGYTFDKFITMYSESDYGTAAVTPAEYSVTSSQFTSYFNADLEAGRPILMGGEDSDGGGHEFVCCGRDANNKFYINWGWEGSGNGYYALSSLKPKSTSYNFSSNLDALIGLRPAKTYDDQTVTWMANGTQFAKNTATAGIVALPTNKPEDCSDSRVFVGWTATENYEAAAIAPTYIKGGEIIEEATTYYAVYATQESGSSAATKTFKFAEIASAKGWVNATAYTPVVDAPVTITAEGGGNNGKWYESGKGSWRMYSGGTVRISVEGSAVTSVTSAPECDWTISDGEATFSPSSRTDFTQIAVTYGAGASYKDYSTACGAIEPCVLTGIALNTESAKTAFVTGATFSYEGLVVTASYSNCSSKAVTPTSVSTPDMSAAGEKTVTVSYTENEVTKEATYKITVSDPATYTIGFYNNGALIGEAQQVVEGQSPEVPATPQSACDGYEFYGWYTETLAQDNTDKPTTVTSFTATKDQNYYAVFTKTEAGEGEAAFDGTTGGTFKIYALVGETKYYAKGVESLTSSNKKITSTTDESEAFEYVFTKVEDGFNIQHGDKYLTYGTSGTNITEGTTAYVWNIEKSSLTGYGTWRVNATTGTNRALAFSAKEGANVFGGYATSNIGTTSSGATYYDIEIGGGASSTTYYCTVVSCEPTGVETVKSEELRVKSQKVIINGQLFIMHDGRMYNVQGIRVK